MSHLVSNSAVVITISFFISDFLEEKNLFHYAEAIISLSPSHTSSVSFSLTHMHTDSCQLHGPWGFLFLSLIG